MDAKDLLNDLELCGLHAKLIEGKLSVGPASKLTADLRAKIKSLRSDLIAELEREAWTALSEQQRIDRLPNPVDGVIARAVLAGMIRASDLAGFREASAPYCDDSVIALGDVITGRITLAEFNAEMERLAGLISMTADSFDQREGLEKINKVVLQFG